NQAYLVLNKLENNNGEIDSRDFNRLDDEQLELFGYPENEEKIINDIKELDINNLTPIKALEKLYEFKQDLTGDE
ncbi:MAG: hypothetical protein ACOC3V_04960, partial [bacterium]